MNTERSSKSDCVTTIDAGRVQVETSLVNVVKNKDCGNGNCNKNNVLSFADATYTRIGLTTNSDLQIVNSFYNYKKTSFANNNLKAESFGDTVLRFKYSFSGNKNEKFGIAITPFVKFPTNQNHFSNNSIEGGINAPFAFNLNSSWSVGGMLQVNFLKDLVSAKSSGGSYYLGYANMIYLSKSFTNKLYAFAEYYTYKADVSNSWWQNTADFGLHYFLTNNFKIDAGVNFGLTNAADDLNYYTGFAYRF
jgi:hypothetical protein